MIIFKGGGINLVSADLKFKAMSIMHICRLVNGVHGAYARWMDFAIYWLKLDLK